ncbi:sporulation-specific protein 15 [Bradysia coprophila]|uniref:sporulation-specific protein 15 n=1 Tax=Bradysia coprophila TaxID=38358 RepID=UPI00187DB2B3|nr:sporulation-specific protein 15 [Bradysia coprophila]
MSSNINAEIVEVSASLENATVSNDEDKEILQSIEDSLNNKDDENVEEKPQNGAPVKRTEINFLEIVNSMEADRKKFIEHVRSKLSQQEMESKIIKAENERLKRQLVELENKQPGAVAGKGKKNKQEDDVLAKAKLLLFEKTKVCKQQEQQLKALKNQMDATKDVLEITKEMLNLRNAENLHFQSRFDTMELRLKNERDRLEITTKKLALSQKMYNDIKSEYDIQSEIFKELRKGYEEKIKLLDNQIETMKS